MFRCYVSFRDMLVFFVIVFFFFFLGGGAWGIQKFFGSIFLNFQIILRKIPDDSNSLGIFYVDRSYDIIKIYCIL